MINQALLDPQTQEAIAAALENNWEKAVEINQSLLKKYSHDLDTMNRLARAYHETGNLSEAKKIYQKVLELDPYNQIAEKNLQRLASYKKKGKKENNNKTPIAIKGDLFLEEPGKTALVTLTDTAMPDVLADLQTGDKVCLVPHRSDVTVVTESGRRIGKIENSLAKKIAADLRSGSGFEAFIKSVAPKGEAKKGSLQVSAFIRETHRSPKVTEAPFPTSSSSFTPYIREDALHILADQAPVPTEAEDSIEEVEIKDLPSHVENEHDQSLEELAEKEASEGDRLEEE
jgi:tetratricopeptide (TPR) repeat protein